MARVLGHVLVDGVVGEARERLFAAAHDSFHFGHAVGARGIHHLLEDLLRLHGFHPA